MNDLVEFPEISKRKRRRAVTLRGNPVCPVRYCQQSGKNDMSECKQNDYAEPNSNNYAWQWHSYSSPVTTVCNTRSGAGAYCKQNGKERRLPSCWYDSGVQRGTNWKDDVMGKKGSVPVIVHMSSTDMFCMPCCQYDRIRDLTIDDVKKDKPRSEKEKQVAEANQNKEKMPSE